jgi:2-polyprenyl-6-methoxyphenol hydroxylase-like FAD-dependent oxidoreductase
MTGEVLVVGAGIAGLAVARALSRRGIATTVVERSATASDAGLGLNLPANAISALATLGLADEVVDRGVPIRRREYRNAAGRRLFEVDEEAFWKPAGPSVCLRRHELMDVLRAGVGNTAVRWGTAVARAEPGDTGVRVQLHDGSAYEYRYVVGADGVHSTLRNAVTDGGTQRSMMTEASWRFIITNPGVDRWTAWSGKEATFLLIPVDGQHVYGYASATRGGTAADDPRWLAETFADFCGPVPQAASAALADGAELYYSPVEEVRCERWSRGRLTLIGDAAHATGPIWAQGAALALEDALVLADLLAARQDWARVGAEFETIRRQRITHVQAATDNMSRIAALPSWLRDTIAPILGPKTYRKAYGPLRIPTRPVPADRR